MSHFPSAKQPVSNFSFQVINTRTRVKKHWVSCLSCTFFSVKTIRSRSFSGLKLSQFCCLVLSLTFPPIQELRFTAFFRSYCDWPVLSVLGSFLREYSSIDLQGGDGFLPISCRHDLHSVLKLGHQSLGLWLPRSRVPQYVQTTGERISSLASIQERLTR